MLGNDLNWVEIDKWIAELYDASDELNPFQMLYRADRAATFLKDLGYILEEQANAFKLEFASLILREIALLGHDEPGWHRVHLRFSRFVRTTAHLLKLSRTPTADFE